MSLNGLYADLHSEIYNAIKNDADVLLITPNVYDGFPSQLLRGKGYPMVIVATPVGREDLETLSPTKHFTDSATCHITVLATKQAIARNLADAVREAVATASYSSGSFIGFSGSTESFRYVEETGKREWQINIFARFVVTDSWA